MGRYFLRFLMLCIAVGITSAVENVLLQKPASISKDEISKFSRSWEASMRCGKTSNYSFNFDNGYSSLGVELWDADLPSDLSDAQKALFKKDTIDVNGEKFDGYRYEYQEGKVQRPDDQKNGERSRSGDGKGYYISSMRDFEDDAYQAGCMTVDQCAHAIKNKRALFYTGAGVSAAGGVFMLDPLLEYLGVKDENYIQQVLEKPSTILKKFCNFCYSAFQNSATPAHYAITRISQKYAMQVLTENFDFLHERSGIQSVKISASWLRAEVTPVMLQAVDYVICVGLSHDDRGFLHWYKTHNPKGVIISFDLNQPRYLGVEDYLVEGDLQKNLPALAKLL